MKDIIHIHSFVVKCHIFFKLAMKTFVIASCLVALAMGAPWEQSPMSPTDHSLRNLPALRHEEIRDEYGQYSIRYITAEDTVVSEQGRLVPSDKGYVLEITGQYQFKGDDGNIYVTKYRGGPDGFHVDGAHLPHNTPVPAVA